jgi:putative FmdB family regulatory protein
MPIYEYRCGACGHYLDALQKLSDAPLIDCPECSESTLKRLISAPSFRLKGSGWYETDFKSDKDRRRNLAEGGGSERDGKSDCGGNSEAGGKEAVAQGKGSSGSEGKSESKSEVKADVKADKKSNTKSGDSSSASGKKSDAKPAGKSKRSGSEAA